ncbi:unnamed protein product [Ectocarpus sp. 4 AP-2014]
MSSIGELCLPDTVAAALAFLDGRSLTVFEAASKGSRQTVQDNPDLYKTLLLRQVDNVPRMASLPSEEGKRALMAWEEGDFLPILALVPRRAPPPRYLHRAAEAADGWTYVHGGHLQSGLSGDVWRFRMSNSKRRRGPDPREDETAVKLQWEQVWGGNDEDWAGETGSGTGGGSLGGSDGDDDDDDDGGWGHPSHAAPPPDAAAPAPDNVNHGPLPAAQMFVAPGQEVALGAAPAAADHAAPPALGAALGAGAQAVFQAAMFAANHGVLGAGFEDAGGGVGAAGGGGGGGGGGAGSMACPRPRCAASWTALPGSNKIILFGGQGSDNNFLGDLWCFHAGARGECRWEELDQVREPRPSGDSGGGGGGGEEEHGDNDVGGPGAPWRVPAGRWGHTMVEHRGSLYMFGGSSPGTAFAGLWRLDVSVSPCVWSLMAPGRNTVSLEEGGLAEAAGGERPPARGGHSATVVRDTLYIFGGNITQSMFRDLWAIDLPDCKAWRQVEETDDFPPARIGHSAVAVGNRILIFGGRNFKSGKKCVFTCGLSCFDVDLQAFVDFPHAEAFSRKSSQPRGMWYGLRMTGHAAMHCSRGLLIFGGMLPIGQSFTMRAWTLDVVTGCWGRKQQRRRRPRVLRNNPAGCAPS